MKGEGAPETVGGRSTYVRWGKSTCRSGAQLLYAGRDGGSFYTHGGGSNYVCMPDVPEYTLPYSSGVQGHSCMYGVEYEGNTVPNKVNHNAVCALCYLSDEETSVMVPAKTSCPSGGTTRKYYGYLISEHVNHKCTEFVCVDKDPKPVFLAVKITSMPAISTVEGH